MDFPQQQVNKVFDSILPRFGLDNSRLELSQNVFKLLLGLEYTLYVKTQNYHWNVTGMSFGALHELFGKQYAQLSAFIDQIAEQIRKYGGAVPGSMQEFLALNGNNGVKEIQGNLIGEVNMVQDLMTSNEVVAQYINSLNYNNLDLASQNMLGDILEFHMKNAWMLRAHLE